MNEPDRRFQFKITVIGDGGVGKTSLLQKFTNDTFSRDYVKTMGAQLALFEKNIKGDNFKLLFWDIAGQDHFNFLRPAFFKNSKAAIIVYSLEDNRLGVESFKHILDWAKDIKKFCGDVPVVIFGNKMDLIDKKKLDETAIRALIKENNFLGYYFTSAKTGNGVIHAFNAIIDELYDKSKKLSTDLE